MKDRLTCAGADIEDGAVSLLDVALAGDLGGGEVAATDDFGISGLGFVQSGKVSLRDDQHVCGRLRADVFEGEDMLVFVNFLRRNLAGQDAAEKAVGIRHDFSLPLSSARD